jgi:hypothetical protein
MPGYASKKMADGHRRFRYVQPGYDPDSESVPANKVIFDSDDLGAISVLTTGSVAVPSGHKGSYYQLVTWDFPFVPLCWLAWEYGADGYLHNASSGASISLERYRINIRKTGIWYTGWMNAGQTLHYTALNVRAADG